MPFGIKLGPAIWSANMLECIEKPVTEQYKERIRSTNRTDEDDAEPIKVYIDDICLATKNIADHLILLNILFQQMIKMHLTISINKCWIGKRKINVLGATITEHEVMVQPDRIRALQEIPPPKNINELRGWIGALRYLANHIPKLSLILANFDELTGKVPATRGKVTALEWTKELVKDFKIAQEAVSNPEKLYHFKPNYKTYLETDASEKGFGAILFQTKPDTTIEEFGPDTKEVYPLAYYSQKWKTQRQRAYDPCRKELKALRESVRKFKEFLMGTSFIVLTDNMGVLGLLKKMQQPKKPSQVYLILRWLNELSSYPIEQVIHRTTHEVFTTDGLSRSGWMDMAVEDEDPGVWPIAAPVLFENEGLKGEDEISRFIIHHLRHQECLHCKDGIHPWSDIQCRILKQFKEWLPKEKLIQIFKRGERILITDAGVGAICGHSKGEPPKYERYHGNAPLYHMTRRDKLASIMENGVKRKKRRFIHLTDDPSTTRGNRSEKIRVQPLNGIVVYKTSHPHVFLVPDTIPKERLTLITSGLDRQ